MKFSYRPSPNFRSKRHTSRIMMDLTVCLLAVLLCSAVYYGMVYGAEIGIRAILMAAASVASAVATEAVYFKIRKKDVKKEISHSYAWVTALILTLITRIDVSYYALIVATIICIVIGKMVFGGFGQNIFNPAAFGEAIIMNNFAASKSAAVTAKVYDVLSGGTPMAAMNSYGWIIQKDAFGGFIEQFGGFGNMAMGGYPSVIGGSCAIVILLCGAFLLWRKDINYHLSCTYLAVLFIVSLIVGLYHGAGVQYALFHVLGGGVLFGTVFMMTDPVTTPISIPGRVIFAVGCAALTMILRWRSNLPDGVLFSILLMNMLTPAIDRLSDGNQIKNRKSIRNRVLAVSGVIILITLLVGFFGIEAKEPPRTAGGGAALSAEDFSANNPECTDQGGGVFACKAKGFEGVNEATITVKDGKIESIVVTAFNDTVGVGDMATADAELARYAGADLNTVIDATSGASFTSQSLRAMAFTALGGTSAPAAPSVDANSLAGEDFSSAEPYCRAWTNTDPSAVVYKCSAKGYEGRNEATITVNENEGKVVSVEVTAFNDTEGVGDAAVTEAELKRYAGATSESVIDATSGASLTSKSLRAMTAAALGIEPKAAGAETPAVSEEAPAAEAYCRAWSNTDPKAYVYKCSAQGFEGRNEATVTVNKEEGKVVSIEVTAFNDTEGVGDAAITEAELKRYAGMTADTTVDATSGASLTSASLRAMALTALNAAAGN